MPTLPDTVGHRCEGRGLSNETVDLLVKILKMWEAILCLCEERLPLEGRVCFGVEGAQCRECTGQNRHRVCIWSGVRYDAKEELMRNAP